MHVTVITPATAVVSWAEADAHLNLSGDTTQQARVEALIAAATAWAQKHTGYAIGSQTLEARFAAFCSTISLPFGPITSITTVKYLDSSNIEQTLADTVYQKLSDGRIVLKASQSWPSTYDDPEAIRIRYAAGDVPAVLKLAVLEIVGFMNEHREAVSEDVLANGTIKRLLGLYRAFL